MRTKRCNICQTVKPVTEFYTHGNRYYGEFHSYCKRCEVAKVSKFTSDKRRAARLARQVAPLDEHVLKGIKRISYQQDLEDDTRLVVFRHHERWALVRSRGFEVLQHQSYARMSEAVRAAESIKFLSVPEIQAELGKAQCSTATVTANTTKTPETESRNTASHAGTQLR